MRSKNTAYDPRLDHLRALAALTILFFHAKLYVIGRPPFRADALSIPWIDQGHFGVALFMVMSGFIFSRIADRGTIDRPRFYLDRALRIYPLLIAVVLFTYAVRDGKGVDLSWAIMPLGPGPNAEASAMWSVGVELQFYLIFPVLYPYLSAMKRPWLGYGALFALLNAVRMLAFLELHTVHHLAYFSIFGGMDAFLFGFVANKIAKRWVAPPWLPIAVLAIMTATLALAFHSHHFFHIDYEAANIYQASSSAWWIVWPTIQGALCAALVTSYMSTKISFPGATVLARIGEVSYSIYAWHMLIIFALGNLLAGVVAMSPYLFGCIVAIAVIPFARLSFLIIERPFLDLRVRYLTLPNPEFSKCS